MTLIWLPLLPPTGGNTNATPAPGWVVSLAACNASDPAQGFTIAGDGGAVTHAASGLCVAQPASSGGSLQLAACDASDPAQAWYSPNAGTLASTPKASAGGCVSWNNANQYVTAGNPVLAWACGDPPAWNELWELPAAGGPAGALQARAQDGSRAGTCASVGPVGNPTQWSLPWYDEWSLKNF